MRFRIHSFFRQVNESVNQSIIFGVAAAMAAVVVASNILVQFLFGDWLTWGAFVYPFAFLVTDITNRVFGPQVARRVVYLGFMVGILCSLAASFIEGPNGPLITFRVALGSATAFLVAQLFDVFLFDRLRKQEQWWKAPLISTFVGSAVDTLLFFAIAFAAQMSFLEPSNDVAWANASISILGFGPAAPFWVSLAMADFMVKLGVALAALVPFRAITLKMMQIRNF